jgi:hypothetical protein
VEHHEDNRRADNAKIGRKVALLLRAKLGDVAVDICPGD